MKKLSLVFAGLLITFFVSWGIKVKMPVNRPDNTETASTVKWYETKYTAPVADDEWILDPEIPDNYVPVAGEDEVYMVLDDSGNITGYRQRTQQEDGSWLWADVKNPNASYESVVKLTAWLCRQLKLKMYPMSNMFEMRMVLMRMYL